MDFFEVIQKRHSYRGPFLEQRISRVDLEKIVQAGIVAPSGCNAQTPTFVIVDEPSLVRQIGQMHKKEAMKTARALIACVVDERPEAVYEGYSFQVEDCAAAVENILLATTALGYATVWIDGWLRRDDHAKVIGKLLGLPQGKVVRVILPIGIPLEPLLSPEKKPFTMRAWFNRYMAA